MYERKTNIKIFFFASCLSAVIYILILMFTNSYDKYKYRENVHERKFTGHQIPVSEQEVLADAPYTDVKACASANNSYMILLSRSKPHVNLGDEIRVLIVLRNGYNQIIRRGGDMVRVWMKEESKYANVAGYVTDHNNGSYTGIVKAAWTGTPTLLASLAGSRESIHFFYKTFKKYRSTKTISGKFLNPKSKKTFQTLCSPEKFVLGFAEVCNLTEINHGSSWYCGKTNDSDFDCDHFIGTSNTYIQPVTKIDEQVLHESRLHQIISKINLTVTSDALNTKIKTSDTPCNIIEPKITWVPVNPTGFFFNNNWNTVYCKNFDINVTENVVSNCLRNRRLWLFGDSTTRSWFYHLTTTYGLEMVSQSWKTAKWHDPSLAFHSKWNFSILWAPHEFPFSSLDLVTPKSSIPFDVYVKKIPNDSRDILVLCLYTHLSMYPPNIFKDRLGKIFDAVVDILNRAPGVVIVYKGPHTYKNTGRFVNWYDDYFGLLYQHIVYEKFEPVRNRVIFLHHWDMTIGSENTDVHPNKHVDRSMVINLISHTCK